MLQRLLSLRHTMWKQNVKYEKIEKIFFLLECGISKSLSSTTICEIPRCHKPLAPPTRSHIGSTTWLTNRLWRIHGKDGGAKTGNQPAEEEEKDNQTLIPGSFCRANKISPSAGRDHLSAGPLYPAPPCYDREYSRLSARLCCSVRARLLREC